MVSFGRAGKIQKAPIIQLMSETKISHDVISLGQGVPFFGPPQESIKEGNEATSVGKRFSYSTDEGIIELRTVIREKVQRENNIVVDDRNIIVTAGANQAFMNCILTITHPGDEVIVIAPTYFNYVMAIQLAGCIPVIVQSDPRTFLPSVETVLSHMSSKTKAIVTISPNNPTGIVYPKKLLKEINKLCQDQELYNISDEVYEYFVFDDHIHVSPASFNDDLHWTITLFSCSKSFGMAGYRIGCIVTPSHLIDDMIKVQDTIGICAPIPGQYAAIPAFKLGSSYVANYHSEMDEIRKMTYSKLKTLESVEVDLPQGAMYCYVKLEPKINTWDLAKNLIERFKVIVIPGEVFHALDSNLRVSFGNLHMKESMEGVSRLMHGLNSLV